MRKKINISDKSKVSIKWNVVPSDRTDEMEQNIKALFAKKYKIPVSNIDIDPNYITNSGVGNTSLNSENIKNINDPQFQLELFKQYFQERGITEYDFDELCNIDSMINQSIDYSSYEKSKRYEIKWIKWDNFLSYGKDNYFDFRTLKGLILLNGEPANESGKSTFAYDVLHFLLFGKTRSGKSDKLEQMFNNYLPDETEVKVEGCISFDGEDYVIRRVLTRPAKGKKRSVTQKVEYYRSFNDGKNMELLPDENLGEGDSKKTTKAIQEIIGDENDFDMIISANAKDLDDLISLKETDRGRLLSRWIGLSPIEDKEAVAKEKYKIISKGRLIDMYNRETLKQEVESLENENDKNTAEINNRKDKIDVCDERLKGFNNTKDTLLTAKKPIDAKIMEFDVKTVQSNMDNIVNEGKLINEKISEIDKNLSEIAVFSYTNEDEDEYKRLMGLKDRLVEEISDIKSNIKSITETNANLKNSEYCPVCKRKFDNVDNSATISANEKIITELYNSGVAKNNEKNDIIGKMGVIETNRKLFNDKSKLELRKSVLVSELTTKRTKYSELKALLNDIKANKDAIEYNNEIDKNINIIKADIQTEENIKKRLNEEIVYYNNDVIKNNELIKTKKSYIVKIAEEEKIDRNWKHYLMLVGKDGITKLVLRNTLPIINGELHRLLSDVADFDVEVTINEKNDVDFNLIRDGIKTRLSGASGLEKTEAALALRVVLGNMSMLSKPPFILLDEVLGGVAKENYDNIKKLYDKIVKNYSFVLHITHLDSIADWHDNIITITKKNNISSIKK